MPLACVQARCCMFLVAWCSLNTFTKEATTFLSCRPRAPCALLPSQQPTFFSRRHTGNSHESCSAQEAGWRVTKGKSWTVCWGHIFSAAEFSKLHEFQRVNHFPGR
jgi:hypothetical protein